MLTGSKYSMWKSKMRDMLVCRDLWLPVQFGNKKPDKIDPLKGSFAPEGSRIHKVWLSVQFRDKKPDKIDSLNWEFLHLKATAYIRCFIDMSL